MPKKQKLGFPSIIGLNSRETAQFNENDAF